MRGGVFTDIRGLTGIESLASGTYALCAIDEGRVLCTRFGRNGASTVRPVAALEGASAITLLGNGQGVCGVIEGNIVRCVGIGDARPIGPSEPPMRATQVIASGSELCALFDGRVDCWHGRAGADPVRWSPRVDGVVSLERIRRHLCGRRASGERYCFSDFAIEDLVPPGGSVPGITDAREVTVGAGFACALLATGRVRCWGVHGEHGQLGDGRSTWSTDPVDVSGIIDAIDVDAGDSTACAVHASGRVSCWGVVPDNTGIARGDQPAPLPIPELENVREIAVSLARDGAVCARHADGTVSCRGGRFHCDLPSRHQPLTEAARIAGVQGARRIEGGAGYYCALLEGHRITCWGMANGAYDANRACGDPPSSFDLPGARDLALDGAWTCVDRGDQGVSCWGREVPFHPDNTFAEPTTLFAFEP